MPAPDPGPGIRLPGLGDGIRARADASQTRRVRALVAEHICDDVVVMVTELACSEPGCPPVETVIALMYPGNPHQFTLHKPALEVATEDVRQVLTRPRDDDAHDAHLPSTSANT